jgi:hypothetical protein
MSVRLAVCPNVTTRLPLDEFPWNLIFVYFQQCVEKMKVSLKSDKKNGYLMWRTKLIFDHILLISFWVRNVSEKFVEKIKTRIFVQELFFRKSCVYQIRQKYYRAGQTANDNMANAHCMLDNWGYILTLTICDTDCFYTATIVARTLIIVTSELPVLVHTKIYTHVNLSTSSNVARGRHT